MSGIVWHRRESCRSILSYSHIMHALSLTSREGTAAEQKSGMDQVIMHETTRPSFVCCARQMPKANESGGGGSGKRHIIVVAMQPHHSLVPDVRRPDTRTNTLPVALRVFRRSKVWSASHCNKPYQGTALPSREPQEEWIPTPFAASDYNRRAWNQPVSSMGEIVVGRHRHGAHA
jgi:hypothetical protein